MKKRVFVSIFLLFLAACDNKFSAQTIASRAAQSGACLEVETYLHDVIQSSIEQTGDLASTDEVTSEFESSIAHLSIEKATKTKLVKSFRSLYSNIENEALSVNLKQDKLKSLGQLEFGNHPDQKTQEDYTNSLKNFKTLALQNLSGCTAPNPIEDDNNQSSVENPIVENPTNRNPEVIPNPENPPLPFFEELKLKTENLSHYGALKSFAVAYQSCESITDDALTKKSEDADGISIVGKHSSGRGNKREITNMTLLRRTHPYIKNYRKPASSCVDSTRSPLIYDFGGKPYASSATNSKLNFFKDSGTGSKELGVDCSGYVFAALMSAGLKLAPDKPLRARNVYSIPARAYKNPGSSMSCLKKVRAGTDSDLKAGDIFASNGHIFIVNLIGDDPLGVKKALRNNSCSSITYEDFDFTVLQSSPSKGATGMNHMDGADYLETSNTMRRGFEKFARLDCANKVKNKSTVPNIDEASLVRHKLTPECVAEKPIELVNESCVNTCGYNG